MSNEIQIAQQELLEDFAIFEDWMDRYQYLIDLGRRLPEFADELRTDEHRIRGCQSQVWFVPREQDGRLYLQRSAMRLSFPDSSPCWLRVYSGRKPQDILDTPPDFVTALELESHLSPTRSTGTIVHAGRD